MFIAPSKIKSALLTTVSVIGLCAVTFPAVALADDAKAVASNDPAPVAWADTIKVSGHVEGGITFNPSEAIGAENIGALFQDKANQPLLNQAMVTVQRPIDNQSDKFNWGFTLNGMFGSDARYTHGFSEMDHLINSRYQLDVVQATVDFHIPGLTELLDHGIDVRVGQFITPLGAEVIDATGNYLYSHSYIFNFGIPFKNTGILTTEHVNSFLDLYAGLDTGVNAWAGSSGYNNSPIKGQFGFGLNLLDGDLTVLGMSHIGAENPANLVGVPKDSLRYLNDITTVWKATPDLTLTTDVNYIADDGLNAIGYGAAQYAVYALNDQVSLVGRAEVWRDNSGAFVASFPGNFDFVNAERGLPASVTTLPRTTYGELTLGVNYKPEVPKAIEGFMIRPELRFDDALNNSKPFKGGRDNFSFTPAVDVIFPF